MIMMTVGIGLLGAVLGSFAGAQVWRLRAWQLKQDKAAGEKIDTTEWKKLKPLVGKKLKQDRSQCLSCHHELIWKDLIPVFSWLRFGGKCRYCKAKIGYTEILLELGLGALFALSVWFWPESFSDLGLLRVVVWLSALVPLTILFVYDLRWSILPDIAMWPFVALGGIFVATQFIAVSDPVGLLMTLSGAVAILSGLYLVLYAISKGEWIGFGDVKLGLGLALFLADWKLAFLCLFAANLLGTLMVLPGMVRGTLDRKAKVPFGPLLIVGFLLTWFIGPEIIRGLFPLI